MAVTTKKITTVDTATTFDDVFVNTNGTLRQVPKADFQQASGITDLNSSKRYYVIGSAPILAITLSNTTDGQNYVLTNTRGDSVQISIEDSTFTIVKYNVSHTGTYEVYKSGSIIYVGIKFGSLYGTQGWSVFGPDGFNYSLSRVASIPSGATEATVITSQVDANTAAITALNSRIPWLKEGMPEKRISAKATIDITTTTSTKALVMVLSNNIALSALFFVSTTSSGATSIAEVYSGTGLDIAVDSFKVSITNSTSSAAYAYAFIFDGNGMS